MKFCTGCKNIKELSDFNKNQNWCKNCMSKYRKENKQKITIYQKEYRLNNKEKIKIKKHTMYLINRTKILNQKKEYQEKNKEKIKKQQKIYRQNNKNKLQIIHKNWANKNIDKLKKMWKKYYKINKTIIIKKQNIWCKEKRKTDIIYKITYLLRARLNKAVKLEYKTDKTLNLLGCSIEELKNHLQQTAIKNGYFDFNINNYSGKEYHIDHIIPCAAFNLKCNYHQKLCFHYSNLQILQSTKNIQKSDKIAA